MAATTTRPKIFGVIQLKLAAVLASQGEIACINAAGYATPGAVATGLVAMGVFNETVDNSGGAAGDRDIAIATSYDSAGGLVAYPLTNASGGDACDQTSVGHDVFISGPSAVAKTSNNGARSRAGKCVGFTAAGQVLVVFDMDADAADIETLDDRITTIEASAPAMQAVAATLATGTALINTGITVAADSDVVPILIGDITGSTNFGSLRERKSARVNGPPGTGAVRVDAVGADGALDADAAGAIRVLIFTPL